MPNPSEQEAAFASYLEGLAQRDDRAALAALRRGLGKQPGAAPEMFRHVVPFTSALRRDGDADPYFLVAALFAAHPSSRHEGNMGTTFAQIRRARGGVEGGEADSLERRFVAMLNAHPEDLGSHLRHAVGLARSAEAPANWAQLLADLRGWNHPDRFVQRQWAREFWGRAVPSPQAEEPAGDSGHTKSDDI